MATTTGVYGTTSNTTNTIADMINTSGLLSGSISFTGLGSGTDFQKIIDQLVEIESIHKQQLEQWKSIWQNKITVIQGLNQRLGAIKEAAGELDTANDFLVRTVNSSDSSVVTATCTNSAVPGAYHVTVGSNIKHILSSRGVADTDTTAYGGAGGTLTLRINGTDYDITINATDTLADIRDAINASSAPVSASIEDDGTSSNPYHLVIKSDTGGEDYRIEVVKNPTDLSFDYRDAVLQDDTGWGSGTSIPSISIVGQFTGDKANGSTYVYTFTVDTGGAATATVGSDAFTLNWSESTTGNSGSISVPADYTPGESLEVENGIYIQLGEGVVDDADQFTVRAFANDIDDAELTNWSGPAITTEGNYLGTVNKTYSFTVVSGGTIQSGGGADTVVLRWTDSTGNTGTVSISDSDQSYEVDDGVKIKIAAGTLNKDDTFEINVFAPDKQQAQDRGLAQVTKLVHAGFSDDTTTAVTTSDATFSFTYGGERVDISVPAGTTLSQLANLINNDENNPGVQASILNDGLGLPTSYKLVLTGTDTGAQYQITDVTHNFTGSSFSTGGDVGGGFSRVQWATNSMIKVDGYPSDDDIYLQRSTNSVSDVITGVRLDLHGPGTAEVTVSTDTGAIYDKIEAFINAVNFAQDYIREQTKYDPHGTDTGPLIGNYSFYIIKSTIDTILNTAVSGLTDGTDPYTVLAQVGIHTDPDNDGRWVIDSYTLRTALAEDPEAVANLFINNTSKGSEGVAKKMYDKMTQLTNPSTGMLNVLIKNYNGIIEDIDEKIDYENDRLTLYRQRLVERFSRLEATLAQLNAISISLEQQLSSLPGIRSSSNNRS